jgi:hypothetical protein
MILLVCKKSTLAENSGTCVVTNVCPLFGCDGEFDGRIKEFALDVSWFFKACLGDPVSLSKT